MLAVSGCTERAADFSDVLQVHMNAEPVSLDPGLAEDGLSLRVLANIMDGLVGYDGSGALHPRLAESHEVSRDGLRYSFRIRADAKWSDGVPVTPKDFVYAFRRFLAPDFGAKLAGLFFPIRNAKGYHAGKVTAEKLGVREVDGKLEIELEHPAPYFIQALTLPLAAPAREDYLKAHAGKWAFDAPVTGPYRITRHGVDQELWMEPNLEHPLAKRKDRKLLRVLHRIVSDESTAASLFEKNKLDILIRVPSFDYERFKKKGWIHDAPFYATYFLSFDFKKPPFSDKRWRRAVAASVDREGIIAALGTPEAPARSWIPKGLDGSLPYTDPRAGFKEALEFARGNSSRLSSMRIEAGFDSSSRNALILEKLQQDLKKNLGMEIKLINMDWRAFVKTIRTDPPSIYRFGFQAPFNDPIMHLKMMVSSDPNNYGKWSNARYDALVSEIERMSPGAARTAKILEAQRLLVDEEAALVPIYHYTLTQAVSPRVKGFRVSPFGMIYYSEITLRK